MKVAVIGLGLIGGSIARKLVADGVEVVAWNRTQTIYPEVEAVGIKTFTTLQKMFSEQAPDIVFVCTSTLHIYDIFIQIAPYLSPETLICDAASVKGVVYDDADKAGIISQFVGVHPMAGTEKAGFASSTADLLTDATWVVTTPTPEPSITEPFRTWDASNIAKQNSLDSVPEPPHLSRAITITDFITKYFSSKVIITDAKTHDQVTALISHLPHIIACELAAQVLESPNVDMALQLAAGSFKDTTRVAKTDINTMLGMLLPNRQNISAALRQFIAETEKVADALDANDTQTITTFLTRSASFR